MKQTLFIISMLFMAFLGMVPGYKHGYLAATSEFELKVIQLQEEQQGLLKEIDHLKKESALTQVYQSREFEFTAYAYNSGHTASGTIPKEGRTIAVDPAVIPLGSVVYIEGYGVRIAEDTGAYIKGDRMDLYIEDWDAAKEFGRKKLRVVIIEALPAGRGGGRK